MPQQDSVNWPEAPRAILISPNETDWNDEGLLAALREDRCSVEAHASQEVLLQCRRCKAAKLRVAKWKRMFAIGLSRATVPRSSNAIPAWLPGAAASADWGSCSEDPDPDRQATGERAAFLRETKSARSGHRG